MKERPILFSAPMVRAILDGSKTQTRRIFKGLTPPECDGKHECRIEDGFAKFYLDGKLAMHSGEWTKVKWQAGDRLWVRETWQEIPDDGGTIVYRATDPDWETTEDWTWRPAIHLKRIDSRITLEIADVRVERLNDISEEDAEAEGVERLSHGWRDYSRKLDAQLGDARTSYCTLWESINTKTAPRASNPWTWVIDFKKL